MDSYTPLDYLLDSLDRSEADVRVMQSSTDGTSGVLRVTHPDLPPFSVHFHSAE